MKKHTIILIIALLACLFITSCNSDAEHGLYQQIATSSKISSIKISDLLLVDGNKYYYYNENGIFEFDGNSHKALVSNNPDRIVRGAYAKSSDCIFFIDASGKLYNYDGTDTTQLLATQTFNMLLANGYIRDKDTGKLSFISDSNTLTPISNGQSSNEKTYGDFILFYDNGESKYKVFEGTTDKGKTISSAYIGFVVDSEDNVYLIKEDGLYDAAGTKLTEFKSSKQDNGKVPAFADNGKIYMKFANEFLVYNTSAKTTTEITRGWAENISTSTMIDYRFNCISTYQNGLFKIDLANSKNTRVF